ncbi:MAG: hypothetical protein IT521_09740 [Burkholderiales bacterium]|nr:hypothetical protein [Burkholderiales bacterium]
MLGLLLTCAPACAAEIAVDHPFIGTWRLTIAQLDCTESYAFLRDGTSHVTSADEVSESQFEISAKPSAKGFYRWTDKIVRNNGKQDCSGRVTAPGGSVTQYVLFHRSGNIFFVCRQERRDTCFGPFIRQRGMSV